MNNSPTDDASANPSSTAEIFTLRVANQMLPLVKKIVADIVQLSDEVVQTRERLDYLNEGRVAERPDDVYGSEVNSIEKHNEEKSSAVHTYIDELAELGLNTPDVERGFVDFPTRRKDVTVCLCWRLGEPEVKYWHLVGEACSRRRLVDLEIIRQSGEISFSETV